MKYNYLYSYLYTYKPIKLLYVSDLAFFPLSDTNGAFEILPHSEIEKL